MNFILIHAIILKILHWRTILSVFELHNNDVFCHGTGLLRIHSYVRRGTWFSDLDPLILDDVWVTAISLKINWKHSHGLCFVPCIFYVCITFCFKVKRPGDKNVRCTILLLLDYQPLQFKLDPRLARLLGVHTQTRPVIISALWQYIKTHKLQVATSVFGDCLLHAEFISKEHIIENVR